MLTKAFAAGVPVVAIDAPGVRDVVCDRVNGRLLAIEDLDSFVSALSGLERKLRNRVHGSQSAWAVTRRRLREEWILWSRRIQTLRHSWPSLKASP